MSLKNSLKKIIMAHKLGQNEHFVAGIKEIIALERKKGHVHIAGELEAALQEAYKPTLPTNSLQRLQNRDIDPHSIPVSKSDKLPLLEVKNPRFGYDEVVLSDETLSRVKKVGDEHRRANVLAEYGLRPASKVLFYGVPGCGKTLTAHVLAGALNWPLIYTRFDGIISSYLGETSLNLRRVFEFASNTPCILFFDEFDAIGKSRTNQTDSGELKRVVNTFLQLMDSYMGQGLVIAATNHEELIDNALWRRFDEVIHFEKPTKREIGCLLEKRLSGVHLEDFAPMEMSGDFAGLSHSDITKICIDAVKKMALSNRNNLGSRDLVSARDAFVKNRPLFA